ncbi:hypothetical protein RB195_024220 [Necator americanus]|uniref:Uncharacterized protein n=1 Tax=Necator americanus TaxID=51031 RepID=A0ABR1EMF3_NECAM
MVKRPQWLAIEPSSWKLRSSDTLNIKEIMERKEAFENLHVEESENNNDLLDLIGGLMSLPAAITRIFRRGVPSLNIALLNLLDLLQQLARNQSIRRYSIFCETLRLA